VVGCHGSGVGVGGVGSADAASPAAASWKASLAPRGGWFPPPSQAAGMEGRGDQPPLGEPGLAVGMAMAMAVAVAVAVEVTMAAVATAAVDAAVVGSGGS
jgi:hypothetical protein